MAISKDQVTHISHLAQLGLSPNELSQFSTQFDSILEYVEQLQKLDTKKTVPTSQVTGLKNVFREDKVKNYPNPQDLIKLSTQTLDGFFLIPRVIE